MHIGNKAGERRRFSNQLLSILGALSYIPASNLIATSYVMAFMLNLGLGTAEVAMLGVTLTATALVAYFLFSVFKPKGGSYRNTMIVNAFCMVIYPVCLLISALLSGRAALILILAGCTVYSIAGAFKSSAEFVLVPQLYPRRDYGKIAGLGSSIGCLITAGISFVGSATLANTEGNTGYIVFFAISVVFMLVAAYITTRFRLNHANNEAAENASGGVDLKAPFMRLKDISFAWRMLPHLLRGATMAGYYYIPLVAMANSPLNASQSGYLVLVGVLAQLIGSLIFTRLSQKVRSGYLVLVPFVIIIASMLVVPFVHSVPVFFVLYFISASASCVSDNGIPLGVIRSTTSEDMPLVSSLRMMFTMGSNCLLTMVFGLLIESMSFIAMLIAAVVTAVAGLLYFGQFRDQVDD